MSARKLVIVGDSAIAEIASEYFTHDSAYDVVAFSVTADHMRQDSLLGKPVVEFERLEDRYPPGEHDAFVAMGYAQMNRVRTSFVAAAESKGYALASYVSSRAFVWRNAELGPHAFVFEDNVIQPFVRIGKNVTLWSGNHIGHHSVIRDNCFLSSHVVVSGFVDIGEFCFLGVNSTIANNVTIGRDCLIGADATVLRDIEPARILSAAATAARDTTTLERFGIDHES